MSTNMILRRRDAKAAGLKRYFSGVPCGKGHIAERLVSSHACVVCNALRAERVRQANPAKEKARLKAKYANNREAAIARETARYQQNKDEIKRQKKEYRLANPEQFSAYRRNAKARKRNAPGSHTMADIKRLYMLQGGKCASCLARLDRYHVDHVVALSKGGGNGPNNLQILCGPCNLAKRAKDPFVFARELGRLL